MDNYPPGAAHDPHAPYNQPVEKEVEVYVTATLVKADSVCIDATPYTFAEREYDPVDGSLVVTQITEMPDCDLEETYRNESRTPLEIIQDCKKLAETVMKEKGFHLYAQMNLRTLVQDCEDWDMKDFTVEEL